MDKHKQFAVPTSKNIKTKRQSTVASSRGRVPGSSKPSFPSSSKLNTTVDLDVTTMRKDVQSLPLDFDEEVRQIAYGKFMRAMLEECFLNDKVEKDESEMDLQMARLTDRFQKTIEHLDNTNRRLKDIKFVVEQKRLLNLKQSDSTQFYTTTDESNAEEILTNLRNTELSHLNKLETRNVDFGYNKKSGHQQLLDAVTDAINGLESIKKHSKLDVEKFKEYGQAQKNLEGFEKTKLELNSVKSDFENKLPEYSEELIKMASEQIARMFDEEDDL